MCDNFIFKLLITIISVVVRIVENISSYQSAVLGKPAQVVVAQVDSQHRFMVRQVLFLVQLLQELLYVEHLRLLLSTRVAFCVLVSVVHHTVVITIARHALNGCDLHTTFLADLLCRSSYSVAVIGH